MKSSVNHPDTEKLVSKTAKVSKRCSRCEILPEKFVDTGRLYLWFPLAHSLGKVLPHLHQAGYDPQLLEKGQCLLISLEEALAEDLAIALAGALTRKELKDTQVLLMTSDAAPQLSDFRRVTSLQQFVTLSQSGWLLDMLSSNRITSYFQPIVQAKDTSQVFAQEALLRGIDQDGNLVSPQRILELARDADLLFQLDLAARRSAIRGAQQHRIQDHLFINFMPSALYDPTFCLRSTINAINEASIPHENVVFEVVESEQSPDISHLKTILNFYRDAGFRVALDDLGAGYSSLNLIHQLRPDFIKLDMELTRNVHQDPYKALIAEKLLEIADRLDIPTIAEGIESVEELGWVRDHGATFVQGYLIGKPAALPTTTTPHF